MSGGDEVGGPQAEREGDWSFLLRACRVDAPDLAARIAARADAGAEAWDRLLALADAQGVGPLAASALLAADGGSLPPAIRAAMEERVLRSRLKAGLLVPELLDLAAAFEERGIEVVAHKGPALSLVAYGRVGARESADLDLLVRGVDVPAAERLLRERGYARRLPGDMGPRADAAWRRHGNEIEFASEWHFVDLHWRLFPTWLPFRAEPEFLWQRLCRLRFDGQELRVLDREAQLVAHCLHGAKDRWRKLLWLCDVDRLVRASPGLRVEDVRGLARECGGSRAVALGLQLASDLLATPLPPAVVAWVAEDAGVEPLARDVGRALAAGGITRPWWLVSTDVWPFHLRVFDSPRDGWRYLFLRAITPVPWGWEMLVPLPDALYPLYYLVRPLRLSAGLARKLVLRLTGRTPSRLGED